MKYETDEGIKKKLLRAWLRDNRAYEEFNQQTNIIVVLSVLFGIFVAIGCNKMAETISDTVIAVGIGFISSAIPFSIMKIIKNQEKAKYAILYLTRKEESLSVFGNGMEFRWLSKTGKGTYQEYQYKIYDKNIKMIDYSKEYGIVSVKGKGILTSYEGNRRHESNFGEWANFSFVLAHENAEEIVKTLMEKIKIEV